MRLLVTGSREWQDENLIEATLRRIHAATPIEVLIHGDARGADRIAASVARRLGIEVLAFAANWERDGRAAGPIRNSVMLREGKPDTVLAFHDAIETSKGTRDMAQKARRAHLPVEIVTHAASS